MRITNIKISCHISSTEKVEDLIPQSHVLTYYSGVGRFVIKSDTFTFTLMGRARSSLNITGIKNLCEVYQSIVLFKRCFPQILLTITDIKIDSISAVSHLNGKG